MHVKGDIARNGGIFKINTDGSGTCHGLADERLGRPCYLLQVGISLGGVSSTLEPLGRRSRTS